MGTQKDLLISSYGHSICDIIEISGLSVLAFSKKYMIPYRTVQDWMLGNRPIKNYVLELLDFKVSIDKCCEIEPELSNMLKQSEEKTNAKSK
jgi:hypothetical protein